MAKSQFKTVVNYETREDLENACAKGEVTSDVLVRVLEDDVFYRLDPNNGGFVSIADPDSPEHDTIFIWWQDQIHVRWNNMMRDRAGHEDLKLPVLPGSLQMCMNLINKDTRFDGHFIVPLTLRNHFDPDVIHDVNDVQALKEVLMSRFIGIPFEICHYDKVKHYAGIITTQDLRMPDLCAMRETLASGMNT